METLPLPEDPENVLQTRRKGLTPVPGKGKKEDDPKKENKR